MSEQQQFRERIQRIGGLVRQLDAIPDLALRAASKELISSIMELHGAGLERAMEIISAGERGVETIDALGDDPLVGSLLLLYGLHPLDLEARVQRAIEKLQKSLRSQGVILELVKLEEGVVNLRARGVVSASSATAVRTVVEDELYAVAPDLTSLVLQGLEQFSQPGFVPLGNLVTMPANGSNGKGAH